MKSALSRRVAVGLALAAAIALVPTAAGAAPDPGSDGVIDVVRGVGSDTTYSVHQQLDVLYNGSQGCTLEPGSPADDYQVCQAGTFDERANYDHDLLASDYPVGSSAGVRMLIPGATPGHQADYARSSRDPQGSDPDGMTFTAIAKDGIVIVNMGNRGAVNLTLAQARDIFVETCGNDTWGEFNGNPADTTPVRPYGVQTSSGTYLSMANELGGDPNTCANAITAAEGGASRILFENDTTPLEARADRNQAIWWGSFGVFNSTPALRGTAVFDAYQGLTPQNGNIFDGTYGITRYLYMVTDTSENDDTGGSTGAAWAYRNWICKPTGSHTVNRETNNNYGVDITGALNARGFQRLNPALAEVDTGSRCQNQFTS
jgi:ABC-type phosphate transport system substrate-binding protein